ncbi:ABC transporter permease [Granulibacter bethesdensis]|uniref:ABC transporter permease protein n=2 Tax=Granulibacter bethesdensis TaxID=364410 RepID=Q0BS52_GRABC|nr:ABC transporter permease [Granulibacter bethesdensis]ABI62350.1 ABC transporter permease protein [Granulibacter bethesdensis CGDNIH1]APH52179.1 ABC transporter permease protein [Granulibacter bethesdensis]APH64872.1 ABC transporter permease protein [Granulibacter bethesdensis]
MHHGCGSSPLTIMGIDQTSASILSPAWTMASEGMVATLSLSGEWTVASGGLNTRPINAFPVGTERLLIDVSALQRWDSALISFLWSLEQRCNTSGITLDNSTLPHSARGLLALLPEHPHPSAPAPAKHFAPVQAIGASTLSMLTECGTVTELGVETLRGAGATLFGGHGMRWRDLLRDISDAGPSALLIVGIVNFLMGSILAFVGAVQLRKFAADIYVANLVGLASVREMSAVMTAIIMAGRTGGAYAARIATMTGNEEIDALRVFGIPVSRYLLLPSIAALVLTMPILYLYACLISLVGGYIVSQGMLDVTMAGFWNHLFGSVHIDQFVFGFVKTITFAMLIGLVSCRIGLKAGRSAADVGVAATRAVVSGIVGVIALDSMFAVLATIIGI